MSDLCHSLALDHPDKTCALARAMAPRLSSGDVLLLDGGVGAGKTHFARCLIQSCLTDPEDVPSPTYTLVQVYAAPTCEIWHADLYRLGDPGEVTELGLDEAFETAICLVEWPDRLGDLCPATALSLHFATGADENCRHLTLTWTDPRWTARLAGLADV